MTRRLAMLALCAGLACRDSRPPSPWVNLGELRLSSWGSICGTDYRREGRAWITKEWGTPIDAPHGTPYIRCSVTYSSFGRRLAGFHVAMAGVDRREAERLLGALVLPYLPLDLGLIARGAVMWSTGRSLAYWTERVRISGGRVLGREDSYSLQVSLPPSG
jgi:hypothetical protein